MLRFHKIALDTVIASLGWMAKMIYRLLMCCLFAISAQADSVSVTSTNHGGGRFSYTFTRGDADYVWGVGTNGAVIIMADGVLEAQPPPGWSATYVPGWLSFTPSNQAFLDDPVVFSLRSCLTESSSNRTWVAGLLYTLPGRTNILAGGYTTVAIIGPVLPRLRMQPSATNVLIQWSVEAQRMQLQALDQTAQGTWVTITNTPFILKSNFTVTLPASEQHKFFRLMTPCEL